MDFKTEQEKLDAALVLERRFRSLPRAGWVVKGSRAKSNHTVLVPRDEIAQLAHDHFGALYQKFALRYENANLIHYLEMLAKGEPDAVKCKKCYGVFQSGWLKGKCPYCEAQDAAFSMLKRPMNGGQETDGGHDDEIHGA